MIFVVCVGGAYISGTIRNVDFRGQELCENRGGRPGLRSLISLRFLWTYSNTSTTVDCGRP